MPKRVFSADVIEDSPLFIRARTVAINQSLPAPDGFVAMSYKVWKPDRSMTTVSDAVMPSAALSEDLQAWDKDDIGYNFAHTVPAAAFPLPTVGEQRYRLEYLFTPLIGNPPVPGEPYYAALCDIEVIEAVGS